MASNMISGFWGSTKFYCSEHPDKPLVLKQWKNSVAYVCEEDEEFILPVAIAEKALNFLMNKIVDMEFEDGFADLTNYHWRRKEWEFKVLKHNPYSQKVKILVTKKY